MTTICKIAYLMGMCMERERESPNFLIFISFIDKGEGEIGRYRNDRGERQEREIAR